MAGSNRVLTKDPDSRLKAVEDRLSELAEMLKQLEDQTRQAQAEAQAAANRSAEAEAAVHRSASNGNGNGTGGEAQDKLLQLEAVVERINDRVEKITHTIIQQAHRFS
jgi:hypothetical protein